jgi:hypothetical protein
MSAQRRIDPSALRAYLARDWARVRENKRAYWRNRLDRGGLAEAIRVTELLRSTATDQEREEDLQTHQRVAEALAKTQRRER